MSCFNSFDLGLFVGLIGLLVTIFGVILSGFFYSSAKKLNDESKLYISQFKKESLSFMYRSYIESIDKKAHSEKKCDGEIRMNFWKFVKLMETLDYPHILIKNNEGRKENYKIKILETTYDYYNFNSDRRYYIAKIITPPSDDENTVFKKGESIALYYSESKKDSYATQDLNDFNDGPDNAYLFKIVALNISLTSGEPKKIKIENLKTNLRLKDQISCI